jgi:hypothetical protein
MKKYFVTGIALLFSAGAFAQPQEPPKPPSPEIRWEKDSKKIDEALKLSADQLQKAKAVFMAFYSSMDALHQNNKDQRPPKEDVEKIRNERNDELKKVLSASQFESFMQVERKLGPPKHHPCEMPPPPPNS